MSFYILKIITLLGGLALFLFGMDIMGNSLEKLAGGKLEAHEYLGALKAGALEESAQFTKRFNAYKEKYAFDEETSK